MNVYTTDRIRNVVLLGHGGCGKTSLVEAMAYLAGMTSRMGKVEDGNTISDYDKEEMKRHFSINTSVVPIIWEDTKINILDTHRSICRSVRTDSSSATSMCCSSGRSAGRRTARLRRRTFRIIQRRILASAERL